MFEIYKRGQGRYTRIGTFVGMMVIVAIGVAVLAQTLGGNLKPSGYKVYLQYGIPTLLVAAAAWGMFLVVNRQKPADFLIATESEMKKVSWSSRTEVIGSTKVVIIVTLIMAFLLFSVDWLFVMFFSKIGVMGK
ncbi:MAG: preprotein translocase subunit SecE [Planctomycetota bacterium]|nr:preprotein translocase subunit SecE [Planctomycetota bacterium]